MSKHVLVAYGSQTGNAEEVSKAILQDLQSLGVNCILRSLKECKKVRGLSFLIHHQLRTKPARRPFDIRCRSYMLFNHRRWRTARQRHRVLSKPAEVCERESNPLRREFCRPRCVRLQRQHKYIRVALESTCFSFVKTKQNTHTNHPIPIQRRVTCASAGLGDTNYSKFCRPAKDLDAVLTSLGARRLYALGLADDGLG